MSSLIQTCPDLSKLVQIRPDLSKLVETRPNFFLLRIRGMSSVIGYYIPKKEKSFVSQGKGGKKRLRESHGEKSASEKINAVSEP